MTIEDLVAVDQRLLRLLLRSSTEDRRADPTDDLASVIANATIDGEPLGVMETISYYVIIATAGHDTTASSMAGGLQALIEHPDQLAPAAGRPVADPDRGRRDHPLGHAGQALHAQLHDAATSCAATASSRATPSCCRTRRPTATRTSSTTRSASTSAAQPNKHLAFGFGVHYCLGAMLARMEIKALLTELLPAAALDRAGRRAALHADAVRRRAEAPARSATSSRGGSNHGHWTARRRPAGDRADRRHRALRRQAPGRERAPRWRSWSRRAVRRARRWATPPAAARGGLLDWWYDGGKQRVPLDLAHRGRSRRLPPPGRAAPT